MYLNGAEQEYPVQDCRECNISMFLVWFCHHKRTISICRCKQCSGARRVFVSWQWRHYLHTAQPGSARRFRWWQWQYSLKRRLPKITRSFTITDKAPVRAFSCLKVDANEGWATIRHYANQPTRQLWPLLPNFMSTYCGVKIRLA